MLNPPWGSSISSGVMVLTIQNLHYTFKRQYKIGILVQWFLKRIFLYACLFSLFRTSPHFYRAFAFSRKVSLFQISKTWPIWSKRRNQKSERVCTGTDERRITYQKRSLGHSGELKYKKDAAHNKPKAYILLTILLQKCTYDKILNRFFFKGLKC